MPDEKDEMGDSDIQVEVIPEPEEEKPRMKRGDTRKAGGVDDEVSEYGKDVQKRIDKLRFAYHEERRQKEQKERDLVSTTDYAQRLRKENLELKRNVQRTEQAVVHQALSRVDAEIVGARQASRQALDAGQSEQIVAAQEKLARAVAEKERLALLKSSPEEEITETVAPPPPRPDPRTQEWFSKNPWWRQPGEEERTALASAVHDKLVAKGVTAINNPDLYWKTIDTRLAEVFPEHAAPNGNGNGNGNHSDREEEGETRTRPLAVAGGTRSQAGATGNASRARVVRLTETQVRLAHRLGVSLEDYAHQVAMEQGLING
jgi:hypothetical protein